MGQSVLNVVEFLQDLAARRESLALVEEQLHYTAHNSNPRQDVIETIKAHRDTLVNWLRDGTATNAPLPLSAGQRGLWIAWRLDPGSPIFNLSFVARLHSTIDLGILRRTFQTLVYRHPVLRTRFVSRGEGDDIHQIVDKKFDIALPEVDGTGWSRAETEAWINKEADHPFDLEAGPVIRVSVLKTAGSDGATERYLNWTIHHIASDFLSQEIMISELEAIYVALRDGTALNLSSPALAYNDFVRWEKDTLTKAGDKLRQFWLERVAAWPQKAVLPVDLIAADPDLEGRYRSATLAFDISSDLTMRLRNCAREQRVSLFTLLLTGYQILLSQFCGREQFTLTTPTSVRHLSGWDDAAGYYINPLCLEADLSGTPTVSDVLKRVQSHLSSVFEHQLFPFQEVLRIARAKGMEAPGFGFILDTASSPAQAPSLFAEVIANGQRGAPEALSLSIFDMAGELSGQFTYDASRFAPETMHQMATSFCVALGAMVADQAQHANSLPLIDDRQRAIILEHWSGSNAKTELPQNASLPSLFTQQVLRTPFKIALIEAGEDGTALENITYQDLDSWSDLIACQLTDMGVGKDVVVGIFVNRSIAMVAGLLGIMKAGAAYLPLDPSYPAARLDYMLKDSGAPLLLTIAALRDHAPAGDGNLQVIEIERTADLALSTNSTRFPKPGPDDLAYVIYTSGSTGRPKGVQAQHGASVNRLVWMWRAMPFQPGEIACQKTALSFVDSVWEIFGPLLHGVPSVILPDLLVKDAAGLVTALSQHQVTRLVLVPSLLRAMLENVTDLAVNLPCLNTWICSGETLPVELTRQFQNQYPGARLINLYGSSEVAADVTCYDCCDFIPVEKNLPATIPIGRPIDNTFCYILDEELEPVAPGIEGELYVGGVCLARGYHDMPETTRERFIDNPFAPGRLFRTGDRARWMPQTGTDGFPHIAMLGRNDSQIKIRGFRVDLSEISAQLRQHPKVTQVVVQARDHENGPQIVAITVAPDGVTPAELHQYLGRILPDYMVPGNFVILDHMPLTPNGKADLQALAEMKPETPVHQSDHEPPLGVIEIQLADIWSNILKIALIGRHDNFFKLGGHSLLATRLVARIRKDLKIALPLRTIFDFPTLAELAIQLERYKSAEGENPIEKLAFPSSPSAERPPLSAAQERLWVLDKFDSIQAAYTVPLCLRIRGKLKKDALHTALNLLAIRHESLRTTFLDHNGIPYQHVEEQLDVPFTIAALGDVSPEKLITTIRAETTRPFDLAKGPLVRAVLFQMNEADYALVLILHHIIADGWSLGILSQELDSAYKAVVTNKTFSPPPLAYSCIDHALQSQAELGTPAWNEQLNAWQTTLNGAPTLLDLPMDWTRPPVQKTACATIALHFDKNLTTDLERLAENHGASLFMVMLTLWAVQLSRYSGETDLVIGSPVAGRTHPDIEPLVGCLVNTLPLRIDLSGDPTFIGMLKLVREITLAAYSRQSVPVEKILNSLNLERSLSHSPLFQVMLTLEYAQSHPAAQQYHLSDLDVSWIDIGRQHSEMDLSLELIRKDEGLTGWIDYNKSLFNSKTVERIAGHLQCLARAAVTEPTCSVSGLPILPTVEREQVLAFGIPQKAHGVPDITVQDLFEKQVARTPDAKAVILSEPGIPANKSRVLSYAELNALANRFAHRLLALRTDPGAVQPYSLDSASLKFRLIGIYMKRSADMLVAILGALKAGYAYVPLDPNWPPQRSAAILEDADPFLLVTDSGLPDAANYAERKTIKMDNKPIDWNTPEIVNPSPQSMPEDAAYIMFTSGSTGRPKGVVTEHRNVVGYTKAFIEWTNLTAADRSLQHGSLAFDICIEEIFPPLSVGGSVVICVDPSSIETIVDDTIRHEATMVCTTPVLTQYFNSRASEIEHVRFFASGGDVLRPEDIGNLLKNGTGVYNSFGPTETTVTATSHLATIKDNDILPIGTPLPCTRAFVIDARFAPVPIGTPGELCIGGTGVARGYLNRPELTAERFITWNGPNGPERIYRTGDRAQWRADGNLNFVGRMDRQVKIRGFRVELGEIEASFSQHPEVDQAVVLPGTDADGQKRLTAYIAAENHFNNPAVLRTALRARLRNELPNYMIPGNIVILDKLPLTSTGKIDRKALPSPQVEEVPESLTRPRSVIEQDMLAIWREVLQNNKVQIFDDFFELGGHSLAAVRLIAQVHKAFGTKLPIQALFHHPTVAELSHCLLQADQDAPWSTMVALQPEGNKVPLFLIPGDGGNVFYFHSLAQSLGKDRPIYGLESIGLDGNQSPHATVEEAATYHIEQIRSRWPEGPYHLAGHSFGGLIAYEMTRQLEQEGAMVGMLAILDTLPPSMPLPEATEAELVVTFERLFSEEYGAAPILAVNEMEILSTDQRLEALKTALEQVGALPAGADLDHVRNIFNVFRLNTKTNYHPQGKVTRTFELILADEVAGTDEHNKMIQGWMDLGKSRIQTVPGSHTTMTYPPNVTFLAERLRLCLNDAGSAI